MQTTFKDFLLESKNDKLYYHGRNNSRKKHGINIYITDSLGYASIYSDGQIIYVFKLKFPEEKLFSIKNPKHRTFLKSVLDKNNFDSIINIINPGEELDWSSYNDICTEELEYPEDLLGKYGFKGIKFKERSDVESIYIFDEKDLELVEKIDITTPEMIEFIKDWHKTHREKNNYIF